MGLLSVSSSHAKALISYYTYQINVTQAPSKMKDVIVLQFIRSNVESIPLISIFKAPMR
jgi:hypothetical protein